MRKLLFISAICLVCISLHSQNPQGFNYQAVARTSSGTPIANQTVQLRFSIQDDSLGTIVQWKELHSNVLTSSLGVINNIVIGRGSRLSGVAAHFTDIDWSKTPKFLKTEINDGSWRDMGTTRLWSVPFSMISKETRGLASGSKLSVVSSNDASADALFEVKRKDGQTVFAVYNDQVNVYVPEQTKGKKGGFAVGGYGAVKGFSQEYLRVTPDSIRFYIDDLQGKAVKGGLAVAGFGQGKAEINKYLSILGTDTANTAVAKGSIALGMFSRAGADYSTSLGYNSRAVMPYSTAIGYHSFASGPYAYAIGSHAEANGGNSFAIGSYGLKEDGSRDTTRATWTPGYYSLAFGMGAQATKVGAMSLGVNTTASGDQSLAIGFASTASSPFASAMGYKAVAKGPKSIAIGAHYNVTFDKPVWTWSTTLGKWEIIPVPTTINRETAAEGAYSIAIGNGNYSNSGGMTLGTNNDAIAYGSVAIGHSNSASGDFSFAVGFSNISPGIRSFAFGDNLIARAANSFVIGAFNKDEGTTNGWFDKEPLFVIGNGNPVTRSNAFAVLKDGNIVLSPNIATGAFMPLSYDPADGLIKKSPSSLRYKTIIAPVENIEWLYDIKPVAFFYNSDPSRHTMYGMTAEEMEKINRDLVIYQDGKPEGINYNGLFAPIVKALQEQKNSIDDLLSRNDMLLKENTELKQRLERLERIVAGLAPDVK